VLDLLWCIQIVFNAGLNGLNQHRLIGKTQNTYQYKYSAAQNEKYVPVPIYTAAVSKRNEKLYPFHTKL